MVDTSATADRAKEQVQEHGAGRSGEDAGDGGDGASRVCASRSTSAPRRRAGRSARRRRRCAPPVRDCARTGRTVRRARPSVQPTRPRRSAAGWSESDADRILRDVEDFGRRQPLAVAAIGLAAGFAASRFLKASSRSRYTQGSSRTRGWQRRRRRIEPQTTGARRPHPCRRRANGLS